MFKKLLSSLGPTPSNPSPRPLRPAVPDRPVAAVSPPSLNTCLVYPGGQTLRLPAKKMAAGAEADLFRCGPNAVAKILRRPTEAWAEKAEWAVKNRRDFNDRSGRVAAWPQRLLVDPTAKRVIGVALPLLSGYAPLSAVLTPAGQQRLVPHWDAETLVGVARNTLAAFAWLHDRGVVHADGSANNVMVNSAGRVALIDCDNAQYDTGGRVLTCSVTTGDYCPPELQPKTERELQEFIRSPSQDTFSAVVVALQLLAASGSHPYSGRWDKSDGSRPPATERRIEINAWPGSRVGPGAGKVAAPRKSLPVTALGPKVEELVRRTFDDGWESPEKRPQLIEWIAGLDRRRRSLVPCVANHRHRYPRSVASCPYCEVRREAGIELMPRRRRSGLRGRPTSGWAPEKE